LLLTGASFAGAWYLKYPITLVYERFLSAAVASYIAAWIISIILYIKSRRARLIDINSYGDSGNIIYDMFMGRELNPIFFKRIHVKVLLLRSCLIASVSALYFLSIRVTQIVLS